LLQNTTAPDEASLAAVNTYIEVEELLAGGAGSVSNESWSALGDVCLAPTGDHSKLQKSYEAARVENIVLDTRSPHYGTQMPEEWGRIGKYSDAESSAFQQKVIDAIAFIGRTSSAALTTIDASIRVLSGVSTIDSPQFTKSASMNSIIGRMLVTNAYSDTWAPGKLVDLIVHESIHSLIYKLELAVPLYTDYPAALSEKVTSPWSGRALSLRSFVHACFVWYGLWRFWSLDEKGVGNAHYTQAQKGFLHRCPLDVLSKDARDLIQPYVSSMIETMFRAVNLKANPESNDAQFGGNLPNARSAGLV